MLCVQGAFGDERREIRLSIAKGGGSWELFVDNYRQGSITFYRNQYVVHLNDRSCLSGDDLMILLDILEREKIWQKYSAAFGEANDKYANDQYGKE